MITKGVASVRSPVCNLQQFNSEITHDTFTSSVVREFQNEYGIDTAVRLLDLFPDVITKDVPSFPRLQPLVINETEEFKDIEYIRKGLDELHVCVHRLMTGHMYFTLNRAGAGRSGRRLSLLTPSITLSHGAMLCVLITDDNRNKY